MKASDLIARLQTLVSIVGDVEVFPEHLSALESFDIGVVSVTSEKSYIQLRLDRIVPQTTRWQEYTDITNGMP